MSVILYEHPLSPYAQKVKIALLEKGIPFEARMPNFFGGDPEFAGANPRQEVPALLDGDFAVFDSTIILEYLEDRWPTPPMLPKSPADRARARMIEELCDTYYEAINWAIAEVQVFQRATGDAAAKLMERATAQTAGVNAWLDRQLGGRQFFGDTTFGWADLAAVPAVGAAARLGNAPQAGSALAGWLERVMSRPSVATVFEAAQASMTGFEMLPQLVQSGQFKREYRDHRLEWMLRSGGVDIVLDGMRNGTIRLSHELV
jgi:glutathione S-transferase